MVEPPWTTEPALTSASMARATDSTSMPPCNQKLWSSVSSTASMSTGEIWSRATGWRLRAERRVAITVPLAA
jgi:hypothetical protein